LATSNDPSEKILSGLNILLEKELEAVDVVDAELNTVFKFPNEVKIAAFNISHLGEENAGLVTWEFHFPPNKLLIVGPENKVSITTKKTAST
jgi:hypothetical protein